MQSLLLSTEMQKGFSPVPHRCCLEVQRRGTDIAAVGVPVMVPVTVLKPAHEGLLSIAKDTVRLPAPDTVGLKLC
jgi:hypothetical protein